MKKAPAKIKAVKETKAKAVTPKVAVKAKEAMVDAPKVAKVYTTKAKAKADARAAVVATAAAVKGVQEKSKIISEFAVKQNDTGSPEVQIALLSTRISKLTGHLETNKKDNHSRRGLLGLISKRRRLLIYLQGKDEKRYNELAKKLNLKK